MAEDLDIQSSSVFIDKKSKLTILKDNVIAIDKDNNIFKSNYAEYKKDLKILKSKGVTTIRTSKGYSVTGEDIIFDNQNNFIKSDMDAVLVDLENNFIYLENFEYSTKDGFFKSVGNIKVRDKNNNTYELSQIYIDEKSKEIIGTDSKAFLNEESFKTSEKNKPRVFSNTVTID